MERPTVGLVVPLTGGGMVDAAGYKPAARQAVDGATVHAGPSPAPSTDFDDAVYALAERGIKGPLRGVIPPDPEVVGAALDAGLTITAEPVPTAHDRRKTGRPTGRAKRRTAADRDWDLNKRLAIESAHRAIEIVHATNGPPGYQTKGQLRAAVGALRNAARLLEEVAGES